MFNVDTLFLDDEYIINVKVMYSLNYVVAGILRISNKQILLDVFGETMHDNQYEYKEYFDSLECTNYLNSTFRLLGVQLISFNHSRLSQNRGSFYTKYEINELIYSNSQILKDVKFHGLSFESEDIVKWIGNTNLQQTIIDHYYTQTISEADTREFIIDLGSFYLIIYYPITTYSSSSNQKAGIAFSPVVNIQMKEESTFEVLKEKYQELLNLLYLLIGYDIKVSQTLLHSDNHSTFSYYYHQDLDRVHDRLIFIHLGHDIRFRQGRFDSLPLDVFQNYFKLTKYQKRLYSYYRKYKMFEYGEENFLGFFRILENTMFHNEQLSDEMRQILMTEESRDNLQERFINKCTKLKKCISYIQLLVFYHMLDSELKEDLNITKQDIRNIVKLRHDITHFNEYDVNIKKIKEYAIYVEFFATYALLSLVGYPRKQFHNNLRLYANYHKVTKKSD